MIRFITILIFAIALQVPTHAQSNFAPVGARWFHDMQYGIFRTTSVADTIIKGVQYRKVVQQAGVDWAYFVYNMEVWDLQDLYISNNEDTVFIYNEFTGTPTPLYVFNVKAGDTITLPAFPPEGGRLINVYDSVFTIVVDSVKTVRYDNDWLETVYTHSVYVQGQAEYVYDGGYARKIGHIHKGLLPRCKTCAAVLSDSYQLPGKMRCYNYDATNVKLVSDDCDKGIKVSVNEPLQQRFSIVPNPATNMVRVNYTSNTAKLTIAITDMRGVTVLNQDAPTNKNSLDINLATLSPGTYVVSILQDGMSKAYERLVILPR